MASTKRSDGEGSVYEDKSRGRWVGVLVTGWQDGKPQRRKVSAKSKTDVNRKLRELREKIAAGQLPAGRVPTVGEWLTFWLDEIAANKVRPTTLRGYRTYVTRYLVPLLGRHRLDRLRPEHVEGAWRHMLEQGSRDGKPLSSTSAHQAHRILARALKVAQQRGYVQRNVATLVDAPQPADVEMQPLSVEEARKVLDASAGRPNPARWSVALALGLRQGEALGLCWDRVDSDAGVIHVRRALARITGQGLVLGPVKSRAGRRHIVMPPELLAQIKRHRADQLQARMKAGTHWQDGPDGGYVFCQENGKPIDPRADWQAWKDLLALAGVQDYRLHDARHTAATLLLAQGVAPRVVMEILGHSQISVTSKYQHVADEMQRAAFERVGSALWGAIE